jgi:hypothetical protein
MDTEDHESIYAAFKEAVNMPPSAIETWLETDESRSVGITHDGESESVGHKSGRRIIDIRQKKKADLDEDDYAWMRKVVGYVKRHMAQRPDGDISQTRWRYSLMNWGHDPLKS